MAVKFYDWVAHNAQLTPNKIALIDLHSERRLSWHEFDERAGRLATALRERAGIVAGDRVGLLANNTTDFLEVEFACARLGAVFVPLNWRLTVPELEFIVGDAGPKVLLHEDVFAETAAAMVKSAGVETLIEMTASGKDSAYELAIGSCEPIADFADVTHDDLWMIMYTSGTTGNPKGAMITYGMTFWNVVNFMPAMQLSADMVNLCVLPLFHSGGLNCYSNPAIHMGGTVVVMRTFDPGETLRLLQDRDLGVTHMLAIPTNFLFMSQHDDFEAADLRHIRVFGIGGAPTPVELLNIYAAKGKALQQGFGMTETSPAVAALTAEDALSKVGSTGLPVLHTETKLVDEDGNEITTPDTIGELWVRGPNITPGYWNRPEANEESFTDGWLHTGDAATRDAEGYYYIVDRWKDMYISGGENVYPAEIENVIYQLPEISEVAVIGLPDEKWGEVGQAVIVVKAGQSLSEETVLKHCDQNLARYKLPKSVRFIDEIPHNATGKVLKRELRENHTPEP